VHCCCNTSASRYIARHLTERRNIYTAAMCIYSYSVYSVYQCIYTTSMCVYNFYVCIQLLCVYPFWCVYTTSMCVWNFYVCIYSFYVYVQLLCIQLLWVYTSAAILVFPYLADAQDVLANTPVHTAAIWVSKRHSDRGCSVKVKHWFVQEMSNIVWFENVWLLISDSAAVWGPGRFSNSEIHFVRARQNLPCVRFCLTRNRNRVGST